MDLKVFLKDSFVNLTASVNLDKKKRSNSLDRSSSPLSCHEDRDPPTHLQPLDDRNPILSHEILSHMHPGLPMDIGFWLNLGSVNFALAQKTLVFNREIRCFQSYTNSGFKLK